MEQKSLEDGFYRYDIGYACGGITIKDGKIDKKNTAPIFRRWKLPITKGRLKEIK